MNKFQLIVVLLLVSCTLFAQDDQEEYFGAKINLIELDIALRVPLNNYNLKLGQDLGGFGVAFLWQLKHESPHFMGLRYNYHKIDNDRNTFVDNSGFLTSRNVSSNIMNLELHYRVYPKGYYWIFEPYVTGYLGMGFHYTFLTDTDVETDESFNFEWLNFNPAIVYGIEFGIQTLVSDDWFIYLKLGYQNGSISKYDILEEELVDDPIDNFRLDSSSPEALNVAIGFTFAF